MTDTNNYDDLLYVIERTLLKHNLKFKLVEQGEQDTRYEINVGSYGFNIFLKTASTDTTLLISPFLTDPYKKKMLLPIIECTETIESLKSTVRRGINKVLNDLDLYEYLMKEFSDLCYTTAKHNDQFIDEGHQIIRRMDNNFHLIYHFDILVGDAMNSNKLSFVFDFDKRGYAFKYRINQSEYNTVTSSLSKPVASAAIRKAFDRLYGQVYVSPHIYEQLLSDPKAFGDNILLFQAKNTPSQRKT